MVIQDTSLIKKYAQAFYNVFHAQLTLDDYKHAQECGSMLYKHTVFFVMAQMPSLGVTDKMYLTRQLFNQYNLPSPFDALVELLLRQQRLWLLPQILKYLIELYYTKNAMVRMTIESSYPLSADQMNSLVAFLEHKTRLRVIGSAAVNKKLIAGIKAYSTTLLWQYSIKQQLDAIKNTISFQER